MDKNERGIIPSLEIFENKHSSLYAMVNEANTLLNESLSIIQRAIVIIVVDIFSDCNIIRNPSLDEYFISLFNRLMFSI
ncbi:hypothetical protein [Psychrobacillus antarcticus]|uniref:hypothetical protein n=1 Tax=Psychrobacillus antarcticus TaxID=2879115 RepID=UPI002408086D|nr:hypothetical protein [Psychrobacillus antarcticus]